MKARPSLRGSCAYSGGVLRLDDGLVLVRWCSDNAGLGDWTVRPDAFPQGLEPLVQEVHRLEMKFGLWVEPEMVNPDSDLYRQHPDRCRLPAACGPSRAIS